MPKSLGGKFRIDIEPNLGPFEVDDRENWYTVKDGIVTRLLSGLHAAAREGDVGELRSLLKQGADVHSADDDGRTPLHHAAREGHAEAVRLLTSRGADVNLGDVESGATALIAAAAARRKSVTVMEALLDAGADVNAQDRYGRTALYFAIASGNKDAVQLLLASGADVRAGLFAGNQSAVDMARDMDRQDVVEILRQAEKEQ